MEGKPNRIHPLVAVAAVSVTIASLAAVAALTGIMPGSHAETTPPAPLAANTPANAVEPAVATEAPAAAKPAPAPAVTHSTAPHKPVSHPARAPAPAPAPENTVVAAQTPPPPPPPVCHNCGTVESIREVVQQGKGTGLGAVAGGILGGVLGHQVGNGRGNDAATVIGAVGGAVAGNAVEKSQRKTVHYEITVRMDDGGYQTITAKQASPWHEGDHVKVVDGMLTAASSQAY